MTTKELILKRLESGNWLAIYEFSLSGPGTSENAIGTRLPELARAGMVISRYRTGTRVKEWHIAVSGAVPVAWDGDQRIMVVGE